MIPWTFDRSVFNDNSFMSSNIDRFDPLTILLQQLLDGPNAPTRSTWQDLLGASPSALSQWSNGKNLPKSDTLLKILMEQARRSPDGLNSQVQRAIDAIAFQPAPEVSRLLASKSCEHFAAYLADATSAEISRRLAQVLPKLLPLEQLRLLQRLDDMVGADSEGRIPKDSATWLLLRFQVPESEIASVAQTFLDSVSGSVRHSQMLSALCQRHSRHADEFLESVMFLSAWDSPDISVLSGQERLDKPEMRLGPSQVVERIKPQRATVRYDRLRRSRPPQRTA